MLLLLTNMSDSRMEPPAFAYLLSITCLLLIVLAIFYYIFFTNPALSITLIDLFLSINVYYFNLFLLLLIIPDDDHILYYFISVLKFMYVFVTQWIGGSLALVPSFLCSRDLIKFTFPIPILLINWEVRNFFFLGENGRCVIAYEMRLILFCVYIMGQLDIQINTIPIPRV